jgi:hypothetical protein
MRTQPLLVFSLQNINNNIRLIYITTTEVSQILFLIAQKSNTTKLLQNQTTQATRRWWPIGGGDVAPGFRTGKYLGARFLLLPSNCCREMRCHSNPSKNMIENKRWKGYTEEKMGDGWSIPGSRRIWWTLVLLGLDSHRTRGKNRTACKAKMQPWKRSERAGGMAAWWQWRTGWAWCRFRSTTPGFAVVEPRSAAIWSAESHRPAPVHCLDRGSAPPQWVLDALVVRLGGRHHARAQIRGQLSFVSSSRTTGRGHGLLHTLMGVATKQGGRGIPARFSGGAAQEKEESQRRAQIRKKYRGRRGVNRWDMEKLGVGTVVGKQRAWWEKNHFLAETLSKLWFLALHSPSTLSTSKNIWRVGPAWGVRWIRFGWEKFSIVFAPYGIDFRTN